VTHIKRQKITSSAWDQTSYIFLANKRNFDSLIKDNNNFASRLISQLNRIENCKFASLSYQAQHNQLCCFSPAPLYFSYVFV